MAPAFKPRLALPRSPALGVGQGRAAIVTAEGELVSLSVEAARERLAALPPPMLIHAPATFRRLGLRAGAALDLLELFAFVLPAHTAPPTARGLCAALDLDPPARGIDGEAAALPDIAAALLARLAAGRSLAMNRDAAGIALWMGRAGWAWAEPVLAALGEPAPGHAREALEVWRSLPEWEETAPLAAPGSDPVGEREARSRLATMLGPDAELRPTQADYAGAAAAAFGPRAREGEPHLVLAEAGTGTGKTLGYVAPALVWAERNRGPVWISTFTRHLQRQIDAELARAIPDPARRRQRIVLRKGRENYLCLLNLADAVARAALSGGAAIPLGLVLRWAAVSRDGDIQGGDIPGWLAELFGPGAIGGLTDRRGECIHGACAHYRRCFVERTIRRARRAELVIANHALVMAQAAWGGLDEVGVPVRYVFDEGHHLFDAADGAFAAVLSGIEAAELRRWLLGAEGGRSRARGLGWRIAELVAGSAELEAPLEAALLAARALPAPGWSLRFGEARGAGECREGGRVNPTEEFLRLARRHVLARLADGEDRRAQGALECAIHPLPPELATAAGALERALERIEEPLARLSAGLLAQLTDEGEAPEAHLRTRIEASARALLRRALDPLQTWRGMLQALQSPPAEPGARPAHVLFFRLDRRAGGVGSAITDRDVGLCRHFLDPTLPFAASLARSAHGVLVTSATLRDSGEADPASAWAAAEQRSGAPHIPSPAIRVAVASPFDYAAQTRAFIVTDVRSRAPDALAAAYQALFMAAGGGALGLFTAIRRLRAVHAQIAAELEAAGITLLAQHVDPMDNATLVDIFRTEEESCLLGTDAMRDGVDVPGRALRLVVFERVPWPRPDILHRARRAHLSGGDPRSYDDRIVRLRLRQAFGRLIRRASDRGVFVLLDRQTPERLLSAFPHGVRVERVGLADAAARTREFLRAPSPALA